MYAVKPMTAAPSKNTLVEVVVAALSTTRLRDIGLGALKGVLASDPRLSILDGAIDLQPVWDVLEAQPGFDAEIAGPPLCFVKTIEDKLGVEVRLPATLAALPAGEVRSVASRCRPPREEIERILGGGEPERRARTAPIAVEGPPAPPRPTGRLITTVLAAVVAAASLIFLVVYLAGNMQQTPSLRNLDPAEFSGDIPLAGARMWGTEVHATLADPAWMRQPEASRRKQLEQALDRLAARKLTTLIIEDESKRPRASVQLFGRPPRPFVRFY